MTKTAAVLQNLGVAALLLAVVWVVGLWALGHSHSAVLAGLLFATVALAAMGAGFALEDDDDE